MKKRIKKMAALMLPVTFVFLLAVSCFAGEAKENSAAGEPSTSSGSDVLVVYFSRTGEQYTVGVIDKGNTAIIAEMIIDRTGADSFEILPEEDYYPYTYAELTDVAKKEQNEKARPAYAGEVPDLTGYSTVFIGAPVWWGDWPMICYTFFEQNAKALEGKTLIPFSTHEGSGLSGFDSKLSSVCPDTTVGKGLAIRGNDAQNNQDNVQIEVDNWLSELGFQMGN
ncbi:MAG: flavodoxin [Parasporobacterium sp.]|nr:flavodoxin [Parasporobacterium sp.]